MLRQESSSQRPPSEILSPLFPDLVIPEGLAEVPPGEFEQEITLETELPLRDYAIPALVTFQRQRERPESASFGYQAGQLHLELFEPGTDTAPENRIAVFKAALNVERSRTDSPLQDGKIHRFWNIYTRKVTEDKRQNGLGTIGFLAFEQVARQLAEKYPAFRAEWIEVRTMLASLTKMLIDQPWLQEQGLRQYAKNSSLDFGYIPIKKDESAVAWVLRQGHTSIDAIGMNDAPPQIHLYKPFLPKQ